MHAHICGILNGLSSRHSINSNNIINILKDYLGQISEPFFFLGGGGGEGWGGSRGLLHKVGGGIQDRATV